MSASQERKINNFPSIFLDDMTLEKEGYLPSKYSESSLKFVWATCRFCGEPSRIRKAFFKRAGSACHKECRFKEQGSFSPFADKEVQQRIRQEFMDKYGVKYASQVPEVAEKISRSHLRRRSQESQWLTDIEHCINSWGVNTILGKEYDDFVLPLYIPDKKLVVFPIELSAVSEKTNNKARPLQLKKMKFCLRHDLTSFMLYRHLWDGCREQVLNFWKSLMGLNSQFIGARQCSITNDECPEFLNQNHIQGYGSKTIKYFNLVHNGNIAGSMTASRHHRQNVQGYPVVLNRLCFLKDVTVQGGSSRLFKQMTMWAKEKEYDRILSWSDSDWTRGGIYKILGFKLENEYGPDYFYWNENTDEVVSKQSQRKAATGCPENMTEREWSIQRGLWRVWTCGKCLWTYEI